MGLAMFASVVPIRHPVAIDFDGRTLQARAGETVAACLLRAGVTAFRHTPVSGTVRMPYCMIGHCFDCLVEIEGQGALQACLVTVTDGMRVRTLDGPAGAGHGC